MKVVKRTGSFEEVSFDKVIARIRNLCNMNPNLNAVDPIEIAQKVCAHIYDGVKTSELDELAAEICTQKGTIHPDYDTLASRIIISNNQKCTSPSFSEAMVTLYNNVDQNEMHVPLISDKVYQFIIKNKEKLNSVIDYSRDYNVDYFGFKTLEKAYLMKVKGKVIERIQHLFLRVSAGLHNDNLRKCIETYDLMSQKYFIHATPTLFHSGTRCPQLLSCFLLGVDDSIQGIYKAVADCAQISKWAGGIGMHIHDIRGENALIRSTNGKSSGIIPMLKVFNDVARHVNQSGKRNGSFAIYLEPHHPDILSFLEARKNHGDESARARDLFYGIWVSDLFMKRVKNSEMWSLFDPDVCKGLSEAYGDKYTELYEKYESDKKNIVKQIPSVDIWKEILKAQMETGTPYICYKDAANIKSNQQHYGTIKSSNLCTEIIEYSDDKEYACCTLASIGLSTFVEEFDTSTIKSVKVYSKTNCNACTLSKNYLSSYGLDYEEVLLDDQDKRADFFQELNQCDGDRCSVSDVRFKTVPQIFINGQHIGGFNELYRYFKPKFNFSKLMDVTKVATGNLDKIINLNYYPVPETELSNKRHRPLGIGVQGLADVYAMFKCSFDSEEAKQLNKEIFASIYYAACEKSNELAIENSEIILKVQNSSSDLERSQLIKEFDIFEEELTLNTHQGSYSTFVGSPMCNGQFQFDLWGIEPIKQVGDINLDWNSLREQIKEFGMRNSLLLAPMPTASTSQILGNNECIEPFTSNIYSRGTLAGQFVKINKYLLDDLIRLKVWSPDVKDTIIINNGSIQKITQIPEVVRNTHKTAWDISMKHLIDQAADRGIYVCQSQSLNLWVEDPDMNKLSSMHFYSWSKGLKTGIYYLRRRAVSKAQTFSIDPTKEKECIMCSA
jgi:ribonucleoside-diphosphate reductase alpha subunit